MWDGFKNGSKVYGKTVLKIYKQFLKDDFMNKKFFILFSISLSIVILLLTSCGDFGNSVKESVENVKIEYDINDNLKEVIKCTNDYANSFDEKFKLGQIILKYDENYKSNVEFLYSYYKDGLEDENVKVLILQYDENEKAITKSIVAEGNSKEIKNETDFNGPYFDFSIESWQLSFEQGKNILINKIKDTTTKYNSKIVSMNCFCNADFWMCEVEFSMNDIIHMYKLNPSTGDIESMN